MTLLSKIDPELQEVYDTVAGDSDPATVRSSVRRFLGRFTHDTGQRIWQFGEKLLFPRWQQDFAKHGTVFYALFGDIRSEETLRLLYQAVFEMVQIDCGPEGGDEYDSNRIWVRAALHRYLSQRGFALRQFPELDAFVPVPLERALPSGPGYVLPSANRNMTEHILGATFQFSASSVDEEAEMRRVEALLSGENGTPEAHGKKPKRVGRTAKGANREEKGVAAERIVAYLASHHQYVSGNIGEYTPAESSDIVKEAKVKPNTVSDFLKREFRSSGKPRDGYRAACLNEATLLHWFMVKYQDSLPIPTMDLDGVSKTSATRKM